MATVIQEPLHLHHLQVEEGHALPHPHQAEATGAVIQEPHPHRLLQDPEILIIELLIVAS